MKLKPYPKYKPSGVGGLAMCLSIEGDAQYRFVIAVNPPSPVMKDLNPDAEVSLYRWMPLELMVDSNLINQGCSRMSLAVTRHFRLRRCSRQDQLHVLRTARRLRARSLVNGAPTEQLNFTFFAPRLDEQQLSFLHGDFR